MNSTHSDQSDEMTDAVSEYTREWTLSYSDDGQRVIADPCPECGASEGFDLIWNVVERRVSIEDADAYGGRVSLLREDSGRTLRSATCECCGARAFPTGGEPEPR